MAVVGELVTKFSFVGSLSPLKLFNADLAGGIFLLDKMVGAVSGAVDAMQAYVSEATASTRAMSELSYVTGVSSQKLRDLEYVTQQLGAQSGEASGAIDSLAAKISDAAFKGSDDFARLGISVRDANGQLKTADMVLEDVRMRFAQMGYTVQQQRSLSESLGIGPGLLRYLNTSSDQLSKLTAQARAYNTITERQEKAATAYANATITSKYALAGLQQQIALGIAPELTRMAGKFAELVRENKAWIVDGVQGAIEWSGVLMDSLKRMAPVLVATAGLWATWRTSILLTNAALYANPAVWVTAGIAGLYLAIDDLLAAMEGGESVIGDFFKEFFDYDMTNLSDDIMDLAHAMDQAFADAFNAILGYYDTFVTAITENDVVKFFKGLGDRIEYGLQFITGGSSSERFSAQGAGGAVSNNTVSQQNTVNVYSSDPVTAGRETARSLTEELRDASTQLNRGGR